MKKTFLAVIISAILILKVSGQCVTCAYVSSSQAVGDTSGVTIAKPAGVVQNDVMIAAIHVGWCNLGSAVTPPDGWIVIDSTSNRGPGCGTGNISIQLTTFYKVAGASEPASYTFTAHSNQHYVGGIVAYSGVATDSTLINATSNNGYQDSCSDIIASPDTTTASCTRIVAVFFCSVNNSLNNIVPQPSLTERVDVGTTGNHPWGNENLEISDEIMTSSGPTGNKTAYLSGCGGRSWVTGAQLIALKCQTVTSVAEDNSLSAPAFIFPNPSPGIFEISFRENLNEPTEMKIYDCFGRIIKTGEIREKKTMIDLSAQANGIYILKLASSKGIFIQKIILQ